MAALYIQVYRDKFEIGTALDERSLTDSIDRAWLSFARSIADFYGRIRDIREAII